MLNEIYFPTIDTPQVRDLQFLITDGETFFHEERRDLPSTTEYLANVGLGVKIVSHSPDGRYHIFKEIITDPHQPTLLVNTRLEGDEELLKKLHLYVLLAPHLCVGGWGNNGYLTHIVGHEFLTANQATACGWRWPRPSRFSGLHADTSATPTAGRISTPTSRWTISSPPRSTATSHSLPRSICARATPSPSASASAAS